MNSNNSYPKKKKKKTKFRGYKVKNNKPTLKVIKESINDHMDFYKKWERDFIKGRLLNFLLKK